MSPPASPSDSLLQRLARDLADCVRFYSRLPLPRLGFESEAFSSPNFGSSPQVLPLAGLIIAAPSALALCICAALGLPSLLSAAMCLALNALVTGAFHEDGLADVADGLGGGATPERRLEIMKDSRVGAFGASALIFTFLARGAALAGLLDLYGWRGAVAGWLIAAATSRLYAQAPLALLAPARKDGLAHAAMAPNPGALARGALLALALAAGLGLAGGLPEAGLIAGLVSAGVAAALMTRTARRLIGGHTGDVAGACEQLAEIAILTMLCARLFQ